MRTLAFLFSVIILTGTVFASGVIDIAYSPYTINNGGSYIVVKDLTTAQNLNCITINTSNVTIDLNGHTLYGPGTTAGTGGDGIHSAAGDNITITNGSIRNFNGNGIILNVAQAHINKVNVVGCSENGIGVDGGVIENNLVSQNGFSGIYSTNTTYPAVIANNVVSYNNNTYSVTFVDYTAIYGTNNCDITGNNVTNNDATGIYVNSGNSKITGNLVNNNFFEGIGAFGPNCTITGNNVTGTSYYGDGIYTANGCNIIGNTVAGSSYVGIYTGNGCKVSDNEVYNNVGSGISVNNGCTLTENNVYSNSSDGIDAVYGCLVRGNTFESNGNMGINATGANRIEANTFNGGNTAIHVSGGANTILNNSVFSNTTGLWISSSPNFYSGNVFDNVSAATTISAGNTAGNGTNGFTNTVF